MRVRRGAVPWLITAGFATGLAAMGSIAIGNRSAPAQDTARGEAIFGQRCASCHSVMPGENRLGPSLAGVVDRPAGAVPDFRYSPALAGSGLVWDEVTLDAYLAAPGTVVPGTRMVMKLPDADARSNVIAYLKSIPAP